MKPRIEKKLSKKLAAILGSLPHFKGIWIDDEFCGNRVRIHYNWKNPDGLTGKQKRENWQVIGVMVNHMPSLGGEADYWGEGTDWHSVFHAAREFVRWEMFEPTPVPPEDDPDGISCGFNWPIIKGRLTGARVIKLAREYMAKQGGEQ